MRGILDRILGSGRRKNLTMDEFSERLRRSFGWTETATGIHIDEEAALRISTVFSCVRLLSETISCTPIEFFKKLPGGGKERVENHPLELLLQEPNDEQVGFQVLEMKMVRLLLQGNGYTRVVRNGAGRAIELVTIDGQVAVTRPEADGPLQYDVYAPSKPIGPDSLMETLRPDQIWHAPGLSFNGVTGLTPIGLMRESLGLSLATERHGARLFKNGARISGLLEHPGVMDDPEYERFRESWQKQYGGTDNVGKTAILENGMKFQGVAMTQEDAQFLQTRKFQSRDAARFYRVPPYMVGIEETQPRANQEQQGREFVNFSLWPWMCRIIDTFRRDVMLERERKTLTLAFRLKDLLRADFKTRTSGYGILRTWGAISANEIRAEENLNPIPNGDEYLRPMNMTEVGSGETADRSPGSQSGTPEPDQMPGELEPQASGASERERRLVLDSARRIVAREVGAVRKAMKSEKEPMHSISDWFNGHSRFVAGALCVESEWANGYCKRRLDEVRKLLNSGESIANTLDLWKKHLPEALTEEVFSEE